MSFTLTETGKALTETQQGITMPADYSFETVNGYIHGIDVNFDDLVCLCLGMANYIDKLKSGAKMKEQDYINATNLAKARIAQSIIYDILAVAEGDAKDRSIALSAITKIIARLETKVASNT